jgi:hypothetical protein
MIKQIQTVIAAVLMLGIVSQVQAHTITVDSTGTFGGGNYTIYGPTNPGDFAAVAHGSGPVTGSIETGAYSLVPQHGAAGKASIQFEVDAAGLIQNIVPAISAVGEGTSTLLATPINIESWLVNPSNGQWAIFGGGGPVHHGYWSISSPVVPDGHGVDLLPNDPGASYDIHNFAAAHHISFRINEDASISITHEAPARALSLTASTRWLRMLVLL